MKNLKEQIEVGLIKIEEAKKSYFRARNKFESIKFSIEKSHNEILEKFMALKNKEIKAEQSYDCCSPRLYTEAGFTNDGIWLRMNTDHPNKIIDDFTWEEVEDAL